MENVKICPNCGRRISEKGIFCPFCGEEINEEPIGEEKLIKKPIAVKPQHTREMQQKISKHLELKNNVQKLKKKKEILELKINNYDRLSKNEIPDCRPNEDAPDMPVKNEGRGNLDVKWIAAAVAAFIECISAFIPWVSIYYGEIIQGMSISCSGFFGLVYDLSGGNDWIEYEREWLTPFVAIDLLGFIMLGVNIYFIWKILKKEKDLERLGFCAGGSGIFVGIALFLYKLFIRANVGEDFEWLAIRTQAGFWLTLIGGIVLVCIMQFYEEENKGVNLKLEVLNYDPVLPIRMKYLTITSENNGRLALELLYDEFEWTFIKDLTVDVQLVKQNGSVRTFIRSAVFDKKWEGVSTFQIPDEGYDFENIESAQVNIISYNMPKQQEIGSGYSGYSDYSVEDIRRVRASYGAPRIVICKEKNIDNEHQCSCGQMYSNKLNICPLCGKSRKG
jgi:RNA polymerase subunit RPABC4/transcription elongation factor Spt4